jgi:hypothetical protein
MTAAAHERATIPVWRLARATWLRNRAALAGVLVVFAAAAGWMAYRAETMRSWLVAHQVLRCANPAVNNGNGPCASSAWDDFLQIFRLDQGVYFLIAMPVVLAMFGGVRWLTREYETGSFRYTWTQSVSRRRWLAGTVVPLAAVAVIGAVACGLAYNLWFPMGQWLTGTNTMGGAWDWNTFVLAPIPFTALTLAAFGVAALAAALIRRTVPAMAVTAVATGVIAFLADSFLRSWAIGLSPATARVPFDFAVRAPDGGYFLRGWLADAAGHVVPGFSVTHDGAFSPGPLTNVYNGGQLAIDRWLAAHHFTYWISYQPHDRLLLIQAAWAGAVLVVAAVAFGLAAWRVTTTNA